MILNLLIYHYITYYHYLFSNFPWSVTLKVLYREGQRDKAVTEWGHPLSSNVPDVHIAGAFQNLDFCVQKRLRMRTFALEEIGSMFTWMIILDPCPCSPCMSIAEMVPLWFGRCCRSSASQRKRCSMIEGLELLEQRRWCLSFDMLIMLQIGSHISHSISFMWFI